MLNDSVGEFVGVLDGHELLGDEFARSDIPQVLVPEEERVLPWGDVEEVALLGVLGGLLFRDGAHRINALISEYGWQVPRCLSTYAANVMVAKSEGWTRLV